MIQPGTKGGLKETPETPLLFARKTGEEIPLNEEGFRKISGWTIGYRLKQFGKPLCDEYDLIDKDEYEIYKSDENLRHNNLKYTNWDTLSKALAREYWNSDKQNGKILPKKFQNRKFYVKALRSFIASKIGKDGNYRCEVSGWLLACEHNNPLTLSLDRIDNNIGHVPGNLKITFVELNLWRNDRFDSLEEAWESYRQAILTNINNLGLSKQALIKLINPT